LAHLQTLYSYSTPKHTKHTMSPQTTAHAQSIHSSVNSSVNEPSIKQINLVEAGHLIHYTAKLNSNNWSQWKEHMMNSFDLCGLLPMVINREVEEPNKEEEPKNYCAWKFNNSFTWQVLQKAIKETQMVYISQSNITSEMW
jgi:hypothetical protein